MLSTPGNYSLIALSFCKLAYSPDCHILFVNSANEAMGINVVQIFASYKYRHVAGTYQLPICVVDVVANVFNEVCCFRELCSFNCCHNSLFLLVLIP